MTLRAAVDPNPLALAVDGLAQQLGNSYRVRHKYRFVAPTEGHLSEHEADAVIFSSPIPSMQSATVGFKVFGDEVDLDSELERFAYLGAPILVTSSTSGVSIYNYHGTPVPSLLEKYAAPIDSASVWQRLSQQFDSITSSVSLFPGYGRDLLMSGAKSALSEAVSFLVKDVLEQSKFTDEEAFRTAISIIRCIVLGEPLQVPQRINGYAEEAVVKHGSKISFANLPPEAIAEMYEKFAVTPVIRRRLGIFYTPSWLARYVINRLPANAFRTGRAVDPTCGSGTFLVCFLERLVEEIGRRGESTTPEQLVRSIKGIDIDPVAVEATRLSLDFFCKALQFPAQAWNLIIGDARSVEIDGEWVVGNLPFGYRTDAGNKDVSSAIMENIDKTNKSIKAFSLILPDSLAYNRSANDIRALLRSKYLIQEVTQLPERVFENSSVHTMVIFATKGSSRQEVLIKEVPKSKLLALRKGSLITGSYTARFPDSISDPWRFSPFSNEFEIAEKFGVRLGNISQIHIGLQLYGVPREKVVSESAKDKQRPLLEEPLRFKVWDKTSINQTVNLIAERADVRRAGPWDMFPNSKVIVRSTTAAGSLDRLLAIPDEQGIWFTDKFVGVWPTGESPSVNALAAYFQTRFVQIWFATHNPSRKLRIATFAKLPVPKLPLAWWRRAEQLAPSNKITKSVVESATTNKLFWEQELASVSEWDWFNHTVEAALGINPTGSNRLSDWTNMYSERRRS